MSTSSISKIRFNQDQFEKALETLQEATREQNLNQYVKDATIQRFEYTYELSWKLVKSVLSYKGVEMTYPRELFREAFSAGWLVHPEVWDAMIEDRNITSHTYKARKAEDVYNSICREYYPELRYLYIRISEVISNDIGNS